METTIEQVLKLMAEHAKQNPTHGYNCACKDHHLRLGKNIIREKLTPEERREVTYLFQAMIHYNYYLVTQEKQK